jgi:hypothetical protein
MRLVADVGALPQMRRSVVGDDQGSCLDGIRSVRREVSLETFWLHKEFSQRMPLAERGHHSRCFFVR